jgi:hypothetical protein
LKLPRDTHGNFNFVVFDKDKNKVKVTEDNIEEVFCKKRLFQCIMQCEKIIDWNGSASVQWIITQAKYSEIPVVQQNTNEQDSKKTSIYDSCMID